MTDSVTGRSLQTRLRLRELAQYYSATTTLPESDFSPRLDVDGAIRPYDLADFNPYVPELSKDPSLTAIAQLAALRLNCQRSFISLIAESSQHVVAEATRTVSPFDKNDFEGDDGIILGAQSIPLTFGICTTTIGVFTGNCPRPFGTDTIVDKDYICIPDLTAEQNTSSLPAIKALPPILKYYLECPLLSEAGYVIGSICVMDPTVRKADLRDVKIIQDMSKLVMRHLELVRMKADHARAEGLLKGLGHFIKGQDSFSINSTLQQETVRSSSVQNVIETQPNGMGNRQQDNDDSVSPRQQSTETTVAITEGQIPVKLSDEEIPSMPLNVETVEEPKDNSTAAGLQGDGDTATNIKRTFARAANLIRQSMDLDATCFLEIPQQERYKSLESLKGRAREDEDNTDADLSSQDSPSPAQLLPEFMSAGIINPQESSNSTEDLNCNRLAFSTRTESSIADHSISESRLNIPASLLSRLSAKFPRGKIMDFDAVGSISPTSGARGSTGSEVNKKKRLTSELHQYFPMARSLMFYPIYDSESQQLYAAYIGFTNNAARGLQKSELTYISGFTNSIMTEVMRLKAEATDNAKSDFISSISHELRSPLHGILASSQLLLESQLRPKQSEFLKMIETCARTLLDIMDHLLDYAKINHFVKKRSISAPKKKLEREKSEVYSLVSALNLPAVVEETTASMAISRHKPWQSKEGNDGNLWPESTALTTVGHSLPIILNISPLDHWYYNTEAGSWRRVVMNLIGNSLKYTQQGYIQVDLSISKIADGKEKRVAKLVVSDTGQGISRDYLKHKLFTPFAQENNLSVGAGLGLSLVRKIVSALHGHIDIKSEVGVGTEVTVIIPVDPCDNEYYRQTEKSDRDVSELFTGKNVHIIGFEDDEMVVNGARRQSQPTKSAVSALKASLTTLLTDYYGVNLTTGTADILLVEEAYLDKNMETFDTEEHDLLIVDFDGKSRTNDKVRRANYVHLSLPIGPVKFSQALRSILEERDRRGARRMPIHTPKRTTFQLREQDTTDPRPSPPTVGLQGLRSLSTPPETSLQKVPPIITTSQLASLTPPDILPAKSRPKRAILLVDDNAINLRILTAAVSRLNLEAQGTSTLNAMNGLEAVNAFITAANEGVSVPIVFMDISMPVMDGCTATRKIRAFEEEKGITRQNRSTIIAITGLASAEAQREIENSGFDVYLRKPVGVKTVREIVTADMAKTVPS